MSYPSVGIILALVLVLAFSGIPGCEGSGNNFQAAPSAPGSVSADFSSVTGNLEQAVVANGLDSVVLIVTVRDFSGVPMRGHVVEFSGTGSGNTKDQPQHTTGDDGRAFGVLRSPSPKPRSSR